MFSQPFIYFSLMGTVLRTVHITETTKRISIKTLHQSTNTVVSYTTGKLNRICVGLGLLFLLDIVGGCRVCIDEITFGSRFCFTETFVMKILATTATIYSVFQLIKCLFLSLCNQVAFMPYRVNGQYIMEGLASAFLFTVGGLGFIIMDQTHAPGKAKLNRILLTSMGFIFILVSFFTTWIFMRMKLPGYLQQ